MWATQTSFGRYDVVTLTHREPEDVPPDTLEALLENLDEYSATRRHYSNWLVDSNGLLIAQLYDLTHKIALGKKGIPENKRMAKKIMKQEPRGSFEDQRRAAEEGTAIALRKQEERRRRKALEAAKTPPAEGA